jgi:hypothetical protein
VHFYHKSFGFHGNCTEIFSVVSAHNLRIIGLIAVRLYTGGPCTDLSSRFKFYTEWCNSSGTLCMKLNPEWAYQNCFAMSLFPIMFIQAVYNEST